MVTNFTVFGSCTCRDIFNSTINKDYKKYFKIGGNGIRLSIISIMQPPVEYDYNDLRIFPERGKNIYFSQWIKNDFDKIFLDELKENKFEYMLMDTYYDVNFGILDIGDNHYVTNNIRINETDFFKKLEYKHFFKITQNKNKYFKLWKEHCDLFFNFVHENCPTLKIILNPTRHVSNVLSEEGVIFKNETYEEECKLYNPYRDLLDEYIVKNFDIELLNFDDNTLINTNHLWGSSSLHYYTKYFDDMNNQLNEIIKRDSLLDSKFMNKNNFRFTVIIIQNNKDKLIQSIESVLNQSLDFENYVQLIIINDGNMKESRDICADFKKEYPNNILILPQQDNNIATSRNLGLKYAKGHYITFLNSGDYLSENTLNEVNYFFKENFNKINLVKIPIASESDVIDYSKDRIINLDEEPNNPLTGISSIFIRRNSILNGFDEKLNCSADFDFIYNILLRKASFGVIKNSTYFCGGHDDYCSKQDNISVKKMAFDKLNNVYLKLLEKSLLHDVPSFIQYAISYDIKDIVKIDISDWSKQDQNDFIFSLKHIMGFLGEGATFYNKNINRILNVVYYYLHEDDYHIDFKNDTAILKIGTKTIDQLDNHQIWIDNVKVKDNYLIIPCLFNSFFNENYITFEAIEEFKNGEIKIYPASNNSDNILDNVVYFSKVFQFRYNFYFKIPLSNEESNIKILLKFKNKTKELQHIAKINFLSTSNLSATNNLFVEKLLGFEFTVNGIKKITLFKFSIIMAIFNVEKYLKEAIESITNQTLGFEKSVQLILVDDGSHDNSKEIALEYQEKFPNNVLVLSKENGGKGSACNLGLKYAKGKYVNFFDSDDVISLNTLKNVYNFFEENYSEIDVVAIPMMLLERVTGPHRLNYKFKENKIIDLIADPNNPLLSVSSSFIKYDAIKNLQFREDLVNLEDALLVNKLLLEKKKYGVLNNCEYYYRQRSDGSSTVDNAQFKKEFFTPRLKNFYIYLIDYCLNKENHVPLFIQYLMAYDLQWLLKNKELSIFYNSDEIKEFWKNLNHVLNFINKETIYGNRNIQGDVKPFFLYLLNEKMSTVVNDDSLILKVGRYEIDKLNRHKIWLDIVEIRNNNLNISGILSSNFDNDDLSIKVVKERSEGDVEEYVSKQTYYTNSERINHAFLDIEWKYVYNFDVSIPLHLNEEFALKFIVDYDMGDKVYSTELLLDLNHGVNLSKYAAYIINKPHLILFKYSRIYVKKFKIIHALRYEYSNLKKIMLDKPKNYFDAIKIRLLYFILYPFYTNRNIWIFGDRPDFADDNAKHLFKYSVQKQDNIKKYFVVDKNSDSFKEMKLINKNIVPFGSLKHKILFLFSKKNIFSYVNEDFINPFFDLDVNLYKGIIDTDYIFLQHGVTKDNISKFIKKYNHNLSLIVTVSDLEYESFLEKGYNYNESIINVLGFPRYDNLQNSNVKKQLLFMPTWRISLEDETSFVESEYYEQLESVLNNSSLIELLSDHGYELIFKPHTELEKYLNLIKINDKIVISKNDSYQDLFNSSSLLITDYSSVFFDFAYLKKPVIYYQPNDDYHYEKGYFDYEKMGFGKVTKNNKELLETIEFYLKNSCKMEELYIKNVEKFFKYVDKNNCKRVYEWIKHN